MFVFSIFPFCNLVVDSVRLCLPSILFGFSSLFVVFFWSLCVAVVVVVIGGGGDVAELVTIGLRSNR